MINNLLAQTSDGVNIGEQFNKNFKSGQGPLNIGNFFTLITSQVYTIGLTALLIYLVWGSYRYMISGGNPKEAAAARQHLTWAIAGMIIIFVSYWLFGIVNNLLSNIY